MKRIWNFDFFFKFFIKYRKLYKMLQHVLTIWSYIYIQMLAGHWYYFKNSYTVCQRFESYLTLWLSYMYLHRTTFNYKAIM